jgi:hypothetical protein
LGALGAGPYFQYFTGDDFFQHQLTHERSGLGHWRMRIGGKLEILLQESLRVPETECIGKGKARAPYAFAVKVSLTTTNRRAKGGQVNGVMCAVGYNFRFALKWLRELFVQNHHRILGRHHTSLGGQIGSSTGDRLMPQQILVSDIAALSVGITRWSWQ